MDPNFVVLLTQYYSVNEERASTKSLHGRATFSVNIKILFGKKGLGRFRIGLCRLRRFRLCYAKILDRILYVEALRRSFVLGVKLGEPFVSNLTILCSF